MTKHLVFGLLLAVALGAGAADGPQTQAHDGYWWAEGNESFKLGFVSGYVMAMNSVADVKLFKCLAEKNGGKIPEKYPGDEAFRACGENSEVAAFSFGGFRVGQWQEGADEFYKDFRNKGLDIHLAMRYVNEQLHGKPAKELEDEVTEWRRTAAK